VPVVLAGPSSGVMGPHSSSSSSSSGVVVIESSVAADGTRQEVLRSLCQVINITTFTLKVCEYVCVCVCLLVCVCVCVRVWCVCV
jgi:hypothetical protein